MQSRIDLLARNLGVGALAPEQADKEVADINHASPTPLNQLPPPNTLPPPRINPKSPPPADDVMYNIPRASSKYSRLIITQNNAVSKLTNSIFLTLKCVVMELLLTQALTVSCQLIRSRIRCLTPVSVSFVIFVEVVSVMVNPVLCCV